MTEPGRSVYLAPPPPWRGPSGLPIIEAPGYTGLAGLQGFIEETERMPHRQELLEVLNDEIIWNPLRALFQDGGAINGSGVVRPLDGRERLPNELEQLNLSLLIKKRGADGSPLLLVSPTFGQYFGYSVSDISGTLLHVIDASGLRADMDPDLAFLQRSVFSYVQSTIRANGMFEIINPQTLARQFLLDIASAGLGEITETS